VLDPADLGVGGVEQAAGVCELLVFAGEDDALELIGGLAQPAGGVSEDLFLGVGQVLRAHVGSSLLTPRVWSRGARVPFSDAPIS